MGLELDWPRIKAIVPGSLACRVRGQRCGRQLQPGMVIVKIAGADCSTLLVQDAHAMMVAAPRPLALCFSASPNLEPKSDAAAAASAASSVAAKREAGADCYSVQVNDIGGGYGMHIGPDCTVRKYHGSPSAAQVSGVLIESIIVRVNGVAVESKSEIVAQIKAATKGTPVVFKMVRPKT